MFELTKSQYKKVKAALKFPDQEGQLLLITKLFIFISCARVLKLPSVFLSSPTKLQPPQMGLLHSTNALQCLTKALESRKQLVWMD